LSKKQISQDSYAAILRGELSLQQAKEIGRRRGPDAPDGAETVQETATETPPEHALCWCGCGGEIRPGRRWRPGHDQRAKGRILRAVRAARPTSSRTRFGPTGPSAACCWRGAPMPRPRSKGNGEGTIHRRKDGSYAAQYHIETPAGTKKRKTVYARAREEARKKLARAIAERDGGLVFGARSLTVAEYMEGYLKDTACRVRPKVSRRYHDLSKCHIAPTLGRVKLKDLRPEQIRAAYRARLEVASPRTVHHAHDLLKQALRQAVTDGLIPRNPAEAVRPPRGTKKEIRPLSPAEACAFLSVASEDRFEALYVVAVTAGLRQGELLGLSWDDLERGLLSVRHTLAAAGFPKGAPATLTEPKTPRSRRARSGSRRWP
jgi:hypothetical protein